MQFQLRFTTGGVVHSYESEGATLAFVRDVVVFAGHQAGTQFQLVRVNAGGRMTLIAKGEALVRFALEDRVL
jgi:hypothetical protein